MAIGIYFDGRRLIRPQAATKIDDTAMFARGLGGGSTLALIGECTGGEPQSVLWFTDPSYAKAILKSGPLVNAINRAYDPSAQVPGAYLVAAIRVNRAEQARLTLKDTSGRPVIVNNSIDHGIWNNQIKNRVENGTLSGTKKFTVTYGANVEQGDNIYKNSFFIGLSDALALPDNCFIGIFNSSLNKVLTTDIMAMAQYGYYDSSALPMLDITTAMSGVGTLFTTALALAKYIYVGSDIPFNQLQFNKGAGIANTETGILTLAAVPTVAGTGYTVGDLLTITTGGTGGTATVLTITGVGPTGPVATVALTTPGIAYTIGAGKATSGGTGINCTLEILTVGSTLIVEYYNGTTWTTCPNLVDGTAVTAKTLAQTGNITFYQTAGDAFSYPSGWVKNKITIAVGPTLSTELYWVRLSANVTLTSTATGDYIYLKRPMKIDLSNYSTIQQLVDYIDAQPGYEAGVLTGSPETDLSTQLDDLGGLTVSPFLPSTTKIVDTSTMGATTLTGLASVTSRILTVAAITNFGVGDYITISNVTGTYEETRKITAIGTLQLIIDSVPSFAYPIGSVVRECKTATSNLQAVIDWINAGNTSYISAAYPATTWLATTTYRVNDVVLPSTANNLCYVCTIGGQTGSVEPTWPTTEGLSQADGTAVWVTRLLGRGALNNLADTYLGGATEYGSSLGIANTGVTQTDWSDALDLLKKEDVQLLSCVSYDPAVWAALSTHCSYMSSVGRSERVGFSGGFGSDGGVYQGGLGRWASTNDINNSIEYMLSQVQSLNTDRMAYCGPGFKAYDENGQLTTYNGAYTAAMVAGMFAGSDVATAMTHKSIKVYGLEYIFKWADLDRLLLGGVLPLEYDPGKAYRVCQSITTWLRDDKYNRREVSVRRTADYVARQVRDRLDQDFVGSKGTKTTLISIKNATISVLQQMFRAELLAGDETNPPYKNIQCRLEGDTCWVDFECSPVIPINYVPVTIHLTVFTSTVTG